MKARTVDGWLEVDGERAFRMKSVLETSEVAREVRRGTLVGVLHDLEEDTIEWQPTPAWVNTHHPLKEIQAWLASLTADAAYVTDSRWVKWVAPDQRIAIVLEPDC